MKLNKNEAYALVTKLLNYWSIRENALENVEEFLDDYLRECGYEVFTRALKWEKGISVKDKSEFSQSLSDYDAYWLSTNHLEDEMPDLESVHFTILEIVKDILIDIIDVELKPITVTLQTKKVLVETDFWKCPSCNHENSHHSTFLKAQVKCAKCSLLLNLE